MLSAVWLMVLTMASNALSAPPNFIFILADDCSYRDLELYGGPAKTPNIKRLAEQGLTFRRCYQAAPMCSPTRHALYTGLYPVRSGAYPNHAKAYENGLDWLELSTLRLEPKPLTPRHIEA